MTTRTDDTRNHISQLPESSKLPSISIARHVTLTPTSGPGQAAFTAAKLLSLVFQTYLSFTTNTLESLVCFPMRCQISVPPDHFRRNPSSRTMIPITDLPCELLDDILLKAVLTRGVKFGLRLRLVNSMCTRFEVDRYQVYTSWIRLTRTQSAGLWMSRGFYSCPACSTIPNVTNLPS